MTNALEFGVAYFSLIAFLSIVLQVMGGPRSRAGYWLFGIYCGERKVQWFEQLPGHYCHRCARIELWIADERKVLSPRPKKRKGWAARRSRVI
jgi:hypothetical protein